MRRVADDPGRLDLVGAPEGFDALVMADIVKARKGLSVFVARDLDVSTVDDALSHLGCRADVVTIDPHTLDDVLASIVEVGGRTDRVDAAASLVASLEERLASIASRVADLPRPRVLVLEWTDPPFAPGHWIPEMVVRAGGEPTLGVAGTRSSPITWEEAVGSAPDLVVCAPCGFDLDGSAALAQDVRHRFPGVPVWAVDADGHFARPGPRLVDGVEVLAAILHPDPDSTLPPAAREVQQ